MTPDYVNKIIADAIAENTAFLSHADTATLRVTYNAKIEELKYIQQQILEAEEAQIEEMYQESLDGSQFGLGA